MINVIRRRMVLREMRRRVSKTPPNETKPHLLKGNDVITYHHNQEQARRL